MSATVEEMIDKFEKYVNVRLIGIAEHLATEFANDASSSPLKESGYAILSITMAYFEMIEQFSKGKSSKSGSSSDFFRRGFKRVYPGMWTNREIGSLYSAIRCGMYHGGMTRKTKLSRDFPKGFVFFGGEFHVNPARVVEEIKGHFQAYVAILRDPLCKIERENFRKLGQELGIHKTFDPVVRTSTGTTLTTPDPMSFH